MLLKFLGFRFIAGILFHSFLLTGIISEGLVEETKTVWPLFKTEFVNKLVNGTGNDVREEIRTTTTTIAKHQQIVSKFTKRIFLFRLTSHSAAAAARTASEDATWRMNFTTERRSSGSTNRRDAGKVCENKTTLAEPGCNQTETAQTAETTATANVSLFEELSTTVLSTTTEQCKRGVIAQFPMSVGAITAVSMSAVVLLVSSIRVLVAYSS